NTCTLYSEITNYKWENGRRYHAYAEGSYWAPNDEKQNTQLDIFHHVFSLMLDGKLFLAPIEQPTNVLDLGTGNPGIWAIELADAFPNATVLGNDLSPVQPTWIPSNCSFEVDDYLRPWLYPPGSFDLIHARGCYGSVSDWSLFSTEAYNALQPGGWFESVEISSIFRSDFYPGNALPDTSLVKQWGQFANDACEVTGRPMDIAGHVGGFMKKAGFINVVQKSFKIPHGPWPKDEKLKTIGKVNLVNVLEGAEGFTLALFTRQLGWSVEKTMEFLEKTREELMDHKKMLWMHMWVFLSLVSCGWGNGGVGLRMKRWWGGMVGCGGLANGCQRPLNTT
ncbi:S-adenosyl-L-methionine-dependent methyltransferase, partial [Pyronema domesticum]